MEADSLRHCIVIYFYIYICVYTIYDYCNWAQGGKERFIIHLSLEQVLHNEPELG